MAVAALDAHDALDGAAFFLSLLPENGAEPAAIRTAIAHRHPRDEPLAHT